MSPPATKRNDTLAMHLSMKTRLAKLIAVCTICVAMAATLAWVIIALAIGGLYYTNVIFGTLGITLIVLAVVFLLTSIVSFCPLYAIVGLNTCSAEKKS